MSEYKPYGAKWLTIDLANNSNNVIVRRCESYRQKSSDKRFGKERKIPHFPIKIASVPGSIESEEIPDFEPIYNEEEGRNTGKLYSKPRGQTRLGSVETNYKTPRMTTEYSYSTEKSSRGGKKEKHIFGDDETDENMSGPQEKRINMIPKSIKNHAMPQSPSRRSVNVHSRFRSQSDDAVMFPKNMKRRFTFPVPKRPTPKDVDYWLPASYQELMEEEKSVKMANLSFESQESTEKDPFAHKPMGYQDMVVKYHRLQAEITREQKRILKIKEKSNLVVSECSPRMSENPLRPKGRFSSKNKVQISQLKVARGKIVFTSDKSLPKFSRNSEALPQNTSTNPCMDISELESDEGSLDSPCNKNRSNQSQLKKFKEGLDREVIGYLDNNYTFIVPNMNLEEPKEERRLSLDKLNLFRTFGIGSTPDDPMERLIAVQIVKDIVKKEAEKYKDDYVMKRFVEGILGRHRLIL